MAKEISRSKQTKATPKCIVCGGKAIGSYSVDLDIDGLFFCKRHRQDIGAAAIALVIGMTDVYNGIIKKAKTKLVRKPLVKAKPLKAHSKNASLLRKRE